MKRMILGKQNRRRILSLVLAFSMLFGMLEASALPVFAEEPDAAEVFEMEEALPETSETEEILPGTSEIDDILPGTPADEEIPAEESFDASEGDFELSEDTPDEGFTEEVLQPEEPAEASDEAISEETLPAEGSVETEMPEAELPEEDAEETEELPLPEETVQQVEEEFSYLESIEARYDGKVSVRSESTGFAQLRFTVVEDAVNRIKAGMKMLKGLFEAPAAAQNARKDWEVVFKRAGGFLHSEKENSIELGGKMPESVTVQAAEVDVCLDEAEGEILYAYDITFENEGEEYQPGSKIEVALNGDKIEEAAEAGCTFSVIHIADDGTETEVEDFEVDGRSIRFAVKDFSVYVVIAHEGGQLITPRVEFHFIGPDFRETTSGLKLVYAADKYEFPNTAGDDQTSQIIKDGETLQQIASPANKDDQYFFGWYIVDYAGEGTDGKIRYTWPQNPVQLDFEKKISIGTTKDDDGNITSVDTWSMNGRHFSAEGEADEDGCIHVYAAPLYEDYYFVNFHLGAKGTTIDSNLMTRKLIVLGSDGEADVRIGNLQAPSVDAKHLVFAGWETVREEDGALATDTFYATTDENGEERASEGHANGYYMTAYGDIDLFPVFAEARWIYFNTGKTGNGATYVGARYLLTSDEDESGSYYLTSLPTSLRNGYAFGGWFADAELDSYGNIKNPDEALRITDENGRIADDCTKLAEDGETVLYKIEDGKLFVYKAMEDLTLYASWAEVPDTTYSVILWKQKISDSKDAAGADRQYDYELSVTGIPGRSGRTLADLEAGGALQDYIAYDFEGFHYDRVEMNMDAVAGDGTTVLNVYYDRDLIFMNFYQPSYTYTATSGTSGTQYGLVDGEYVKLTRSGWFSYTWSYTGADGRSVTYTGTRYTRSGGSMALAFTYTGLYGQTLAQNGYAWPEDIWWYSSYTSSGGSYSGSGTRTTFLDAFLISDGSTEQIFYGIDGSGSSTIYFYRESLEGDYELANQVVSSSANFNISDKYDGFTAYGYKKDNGSIVTVGSDKDSDGYYAKNISGWTNLHIYFSRNSYDLTMDVNYPNLAGLVFPDGESEDRTVSLPYEQTVAAYGPSGNGYFVPFGPEHYLFSGWFEDKTCTVPFDFGSTMPAANKVIYAKWTPEVFRVQIDPNGAEIDHINHAADAYSAYGIAGFRPDGSGYNRSRSTYINATYNEAISEYTLERNYAPINDADAAEMEPSEVFYYLNTQYQSTDGTGLPSDLRNALYITEAEIDAYYEFYASSVTYNLENLPELFPGLQLLGKAAWKSLYLSEQKYRRLNPGEHYEFLGWFKVAEDGTVENMPYNFADPVKGPMTLRASWRLDGGYTILYTPEYIMPDGTVINGDMESWIDPPAAGLTYADQAKTEIYRQPTGITANGIETEDYIFRGWRLVSVRTSVDSDGHITSVSYTPLEEDVFYDPGDDFIVQAQMADNNLIIHMQAVYEQKDQSYRRPDVANLTLDANTGYLTDAEGNELVQGINLPWSGVGTIALDADEDRMIFGDLQSNAAVHLYRYATKLAPAGVNYFAHPEGYLLLGFDQEADEGDFIATFPADAVIALQRADRKTLYAVWEPMVYINFVNETTGNVAFGLSSEEDTTLYVVNERNGAYDRVAVEDAGALSVDAGKTLRLAVPYGAGKELTVSGTNHLGTGYMMTVTSTIEGDFSDQGRTGDPSAVNAGNGSSFLLSDRLVVDEKGLTITFTAEKSNRTLVLDDNWSGGNVQEIYLRDDVTSYELPSSTTTRLGYVFQGWARSRNAQSPEYDAASDPQTLTIESVGALFGGSDTVTLYAVWSANVERGTVYVYKSVPKPGDQDKAFAFTAAFSGKYKRSGYSGTNNIAEQSVSMEISHGGYLVLTTKQDVGRDKVGGTQGTYAFLEMEVKACDPDGNVLQTETLRWKNSSRGNVTFTELDFSVTEADYGRDFYDTSVEIAGTTTDYELSASGSRKVVWDATDAGGTAIFTNSRRTADIALRKVLNGTNTAGTFRFEASYELDGKTVSLGTVSVTSGTAGHVFRNIPVGAVFTAEELSDGDYVVSAKAVSGAANLRSEAEMFALTVEKDDVIIFTNTVRTFPVTFVKVDQNGDPGVEAFFRLASATGTIDSQLYPNASTGVFWTGELAVGDYTLTETWVEAGYQGLAAPVSLALSGTDGGTLTADNVQDVSISGDAESGFVVTVRNKKTIDITIIKVLQDPLISSRRFDFTARIEAEGETETRSFTVGSDEPYVLNVPAGAEVTIEEAALDVYLTDVMFGEETYENTGSIVLGGAAHPLDGNASVTFTNTRKTVDVTVKKIVRGGSSSPFPFIVRLANGANPVQGYALADGLSTSAEGEIRFGLDHNGMQILTVPVGAVLTVTEEPGDAFTAVAVCEGGTPDADDADNVVKISPVEGSETIVFTNTVVDPPAPTGADEDGFPYVVLLAGGAMLLLLVLLGRRRKEEQA